MLAIRTILHPTDFSDRSESAFRLACALARDYGANLILVHVIPPPVVVFGEGVVPPEPENYRAQLKTKMLDMAVPEIKGRVERIMLEGDPTREIVRLAREKECDLIVMGTHGWTGLTRLLMGSVAEHVVRKAHCPVLTVKVPFAEKEAVEEAPALAEA